MSGRWGGSGRSRGWGRLVGCVGVCVSGGGDGDGDGVGGRKSGFRRLERRSGLCVRRSAAGSS